MTTVKAQYEAYPYPERDPADETRRLVTGSPSHPLEIDHFLFDGCRDWSKPLRVLVAGGGTGDGLIQIAALMKQAGCPCELTYLDLSSASRKLAEARAAVRGLDGITFLTGSLLDAPDLGLFDYIDCCGVLHHLPDPAAGFAALRGALAPGGGMGFMVYAPHGRSGVYPLQSAFAALFAGLSPQDRLSRAREVLARLPKGHPFLSNPNLGDHKDSDAGFYDLLLHSQDRAFSVTDLFEVLQATGWALSGFTMPALYDLSRLAERPAHLSEPEAMAVAEQLNGTIKAHVGYAVASDAARGPASGRNHARIPHLKGIDPRALAQAVAQGKQPQLGFGSVSARLVLPPEAAPLIAAIDGRRSLAGIARHTRMDPISMGAIWARIEAELTGWGALLYSSILARGR